MSHVRGRHYAHRCPSCGSTLVCDRPRLPPTNREFAYKCECGRESRRNERPDAGEINWAAVEPTAPKFTEVKSTFTCPKCSHPAWMHKYKTFGNLELTKLCDSSWVRWTR